MSFSAVDCFGYSGHFVAIQIVRDEITWMQFFDKIQLPPRAQNGSIDGSTNAQPSDRAAAPIRLGRDVSVGHWSPTARRGKLSAKATAGYGRRRSIGVSNKAEAGR